METNTAENTEIQGNPFRGEIGNVLPFHDIEAARRTLEELNRNLDRIRSKESTFDDKMDSIVTMLAAIMPEVYKEMISIAPNVDRSLIASRAISAIKDTASMLMKRRDIEVSEEVDVNNPKFQIVFSWFMDIFHTSLVEQGVDDILISNVFNDLALKLAGWEDIVNKRLKGVSAKALANVKNPLFDHNGTVEI